MSIEAMKKMLEALEFAQKGAQGWTFFLPDAITAGRQAIEQAERQQALDKMAENARELGLDYEPVQSEKQEPTEDMVLALRGASGLGTEDAIDALRDVLAVMPFYTTPQPQQEPVAWVNWCAATGNRSVSFECESELASQPLYFGITQITQNHYSNEIEWVGLTQEDIDIAFDDTQEGGGFNEFARAIEAKLRFKNT